MQCAVVGYSFVRRRMLTAGGTYENELKKLIHDSITVNSSRAARLLRSSFRHPLGYAYRVII